jgi:hypothetical protein
VVDEVDAAIGAARETGAIFGLALGAKHNRRRVYYTQKLFRLAERAFAANNFFRMLRLGSELKFLAGNNSVAVSG